MRVKIQVTKQDIQKGRRTDSARCPVARAMRRKLRGNISADGFSLGFLGGVEIFTPNRVERFIGKFDDEEVPRKSLKPFSFVLNVPKKAVR